jgi:hypothetical protein
VQPASEREWFGQLYRGWLRNHLQSELHQLQRGCVFLQHGGRQHLSVDRRVRGVHSTALTMHYPE